MAHAEQLVDSVRQPEAELEAAVGEETNGASPQMGVLVGQNVGGALGQEFGRRNGVHACAPPETVVKGECRSPWE